MKKVLVMALVAILVVAMGTTAFAAGSIDDPTSVDTNSASNDIPMFGYIGPDGKITPGQPPTVKTIDVSIPTQMLWAAFESNFAGGSAPLTSANHKVTCNTGSADVDVTVVGFNTVNVSAVPGTATINLGLNVTNSIGSPTNLANVANLFSLSGGGEKIATLTPGDGVNMLITGSYTDTGAFPTTAIQPEYKLVLKLDAIS